jgi:UDP-N-acetylmuramate: L-alanyl-gamma-D-glutamyl-meso-diaminopimelate ligase
MAFGSTTRRRLMHVHILGIAGTFMAGLACLAKEKGYTVTGQDANIYPPMSTQLEKLGIQLYEGYDDTFITQHTPDCVIVGNALSRGVPVIETLLNRSIPYQSGPDWLKTHILKNRWVIGVAGTHGKTTTSSMVAWILEYAGFNPGFLIGGIPSNFETSARLGSEPYFVIEADEYDTAFFDKRSKFVHYSPQTCILNNLEYDHADIFENMDAIYKQFHHLVRTIPSKGLIIRPKKDAHLDTVLNVKCWTPIQTFGSEEGDWQAKKLNADGSAFEVLYQKQKVGEIHWGLIGEHNVLNALAALAAARHAGIQLDVAIKGLSGFKSVKRRMEVRGKVKDVTVYDDFAHHPTAIQTTLEGLYQKVDRANKIFAVLDLRSNTMKKGTHQATLGASLSLADEVVIFKSSDIQWDIGQVIADLGANKGLILEDTSEIASYLAKAAKAHDHILIMSNGGFEGIHEKVLNALEVG